MAGDPSGLGSRAGRRPHMAVNSTVLVWWPLPFCFSSARSLSRRSRRQDTAGRCAPAGTLLRRFGIGRRSRGASATWLDAGDQHPHRVPIREGNRTPARTGSRAGPAPVDVIVARHRWASGGATGDPHNPDRVSTLRPGRRGIRRELGPTGETRPLTLDSEECQKAARCSRSAAEAVPRRRLGTLDAR